MQVKAFLYSIVLYNILMDRKYDGAESSYDVYDAVANLGVALQLGVEASPQCNFKEYTRLCVAINVKNAPKY